MLLVKDSSSFTRDWTHDNNEIWLLLLVEFIILISILGFDGAPAGRGSGSPKIIYND